MAAKDDLEAIRLIVDVLQGFDKNEQERIFRWSREKLGLDTSNTVFHEVKQPVNTSLPQHPHPLESKPLKEAEETKDIKTFVDSKNPKSDVHFATVVAYYFEFEAPELDKKTEVSSNDIQEACRRAKRSRMKNPGQTLRNAHAAGLLDKGMETGAYSINAVGENLVAMTLPVGNSNLVSGGRSIKGGRAGKRAPNKKGTSKPTKLLKTKKQK
jgi:hypothetical protein